MVPVFGGVLGYVTNRFAGIRSGWVGVSSLPVVWGVGMLHVMAKRTVVQTLCDLPHSGEVEGDTVRLVVPTGTYEVDLCPAHVTDVLGPLVRVARKAPRAAPKGKR